MKTLFKFAAITVTTLAFAATAQAAGTVKGKVAAGEAKARTENYTISKDPDVCGTGTRTFEAIKIKNGVLLDTVVYLDKVKGGSKTFSAGMKKVTINQEGCEFKPFFSVMQKGGELEAVNSDPVLHNIHTYELIGRARRTLMNVSQPEKGNIVTKKVKTRKGVGMKIECDAHDFMHAFVFVAKNPYFSVVKEDGSFEIADVPPGKYTIKVWHGVLGEKKGKIEVKDGGTASIDFSY